MRHVGLWLLFATGFALTACAPSQQPAPAPSGQAVPGSVSPTPPGPVPASSSRPVVPPPNPSPNPSTPLVQFGRQGGLAGLADELVVQQDGTFTLTRRRPAVTKSGRLTPTDLAELHRVLAAADLAHQPRVQPAKGNDLFTYHVVTDGAEILAMDGGMTDTLKPVVATLSGIVDRYSG